MNILKWILIYFFAFLIGVKLYLTVIFHITLDKYSIVLLLALCFILIYKSKISWYIGIAIFLYGIYTLVFISSKVAEPTTMEFTSSLNYLIYGEHTGFFMRGVINIIPDYFYLITLIIFLTKKVRQQYHVTRK